MPKSSTGYYTFIFFLCRGLEELLMYDGDDMEDVFCLTFEVCITSNNDYDVLDKGLAAACLLS